MFERALTVALAFLTTCGLATQAIAREIFHDEIVQLAQADSIEQNATEPTQPQPSVGVQRLQTRLAELGYYNGPLNGIFDIITRDALATFQSENGLVGTGVLDPLTSERLANPSGQQSSPNGSDDTFVDPAVESLETPNNTPSPQGEPNAPQGNPNVLTQPETSPTPLPPVPEGNAPEDLIESENNGQFAEEAESPNTTGNEETGEEIVPDPSTASPDSNPELNLESVDPEDETAVATTNRDQSRILMLGLVILGLGSFGTGLVLWLAKRGARSADTSVDSDTEIAPSVTMVEQSSGSSPKDTQPITQLHDDRLPTPVSTVSEPLNSEPLTSESLSPELLSIKSQALSLDTTPESRVAKINIIDELIQDLASPDPTTRHKAIWELGQRGNSVAVQPLSSLLIEADSHEQGLVLAALSEISMKTLKPMNRAVALALQGDNPEVRKNAIRDLTRIYDSLGQVGRLLGHATVDSDPEVRQTANWALEQLNHIRLSANESATFLQENPDSIERLPDDGSTSR